MNSDPGFYKELPLWSHWDAQRAGMPIEDAIEFILYGRAWVTGLTGRFGPYLAINVMSDVAPLVPNGPQPAIVIRADRYQLGVNAHERVNHLFKSYETDGYHGGGLLDEVAALVSLILGTRIKAGPIVRRFDQANVEGVPSFWSGLRAPYLPERTDRLRVIPDSRNAVGVEEINELALTVKLGRKDRRALIRAARLYQNALWIAEEETALAWLLFVSAIETIAQRVKTMDSDPVELLKQSKPDLVSKLEGLHPNAIEHVADEFGETLKVTRSFRETVHRYLPGAPTRRPPLYAQIDWDWGKLKKGIDQIYKLRSTALHEGIPFPAPLCEPPSPTIDEAGKRGVEGESPQGDSWLGISGWRKKELPMYIHVFAHITRGVLLNWMRETAEGGAGVTGSEVA